MTKRVRMMRLLNTHAATYGRMAELQRTMDEYKLSGLVHLMRKYLGPEIVTPTQIATQIRMYKKEFGALLFNYTDNDISRVEMNALALMIYGIKQIDDEGK